MIWQNNKFWHRMTHDTSDTWHVRHFLQPYQLLKIWWRSDDFWQSYDNLNFIVVTFGQKLPKFGNIFQSYFMSTASIPENLVKIRQFLKDLWQSKFHCSNFWPKMAKILANFFSKLLYKRNIHSWKFGNDRTIFDGVMTILSSL